MKRIIMLALSLVLLTWGWAAAAVSIGLNDVINTVERSFRTDDNNSPLIGDFTADFFQVTRLSREKRELRGDGRVSVKLPAHGQPLMFRFEYYRPAQQEIVSDGRSMWIYQPDNRQVILSDVSFLYDRRGMGPNEPAVNFLQGLGRISKDFQINFASGMYDAGGNYVLELTPRRSMLNTRRILLVVDRTSVLALKSTRSTGANQPAAPPVPAPPASRKAAPAGRSQFPAPTAGFGLSSDPFPILSSTVEGHDGTSVTMEFSNIRVNTRLSDAEFRFIIPGDAQVVRPSEKNLPR